MTENKQHLNEQTPECSMTITDGNRITEWLNPATLLATQYGTVTQLRWLEMERDRISPRTRDEIKIVDWCGMVALTRFPRKERV
jgi:hypothetical protein